ncbi:hypothetical protein Hanom_Chr03g00202301 [Helianthus anomalus]
MTILRRWNCSSLNKKKLVLFIELSRLRISFFSFPFRSNHIMGSWVGIRVMVRKCFQRFFEYLSDEEGRLTSSPVGAKPLALMNKQERESERSTLLD